MSFETSTPGSPEFNPYYTDHEAGSTDGQSFVAAEGHDPGVNTTNITVTHRNALDATPQVYEGQSETVEPKTQGVVAQPAGNEAHAAEAQRILDGRTRLSRSLVREDGIAQEVTNAEGMHVDVVLDEPVPFKSTSSFIAAIGAMLERAKIIQPEGVRPEQQEAYKQQLEKSAEQLKEALDESREVIRQGVVRGVDDIQVDAYIGLRTDESILPPLFRDLHRQAEQESGEPMSFLTWMTDRATDEQLTNVWQWHNDYLDKLDSNPEFQATAAEVKREHKEGTLTAITAGDLHLRMVAGLDKITSLDIVHGSPFSPITATALANVDSANNRVTVQPDITKRVLFHELTHVHGGLTEALNEGATEIITGVIHDHVRPDEEPYDLDNTVYKLNVDTVRRIQRLSEGAIGSYQLSDSYARDNGVPETSTDLGLEIDEKAFDGIPLLAPLLTAGQRVANGHAGTYTHGQLLLMQHHLLHDNIALLEDMFFDQEGNRIHHTVKSLRAQLHTPEIAARHSAFDLKVMDAVLATA